MTNYARAFYYLYQLNRRSRWPPNKLEDYRNRELKRIVRYAYDHVPFYNRKFKEAGVDPDAVKTNRDLNRLPIIRKNEIRENLKEMVSNDFDAKMLRKVSTSGSTGEPLFIYLSDSEVEFRKAKHIRANSSLGQKPWDKWVTLTGPQHVSKTTRLQRIFGLYIPTTLSVFNDVQTQISILEKLQPAVLDGYSSSLFILAKEVEKRRIRTITPKFIIGGAELIDYNSRQFVEEVFKVPFYDQYGSVELERMAWECPERSGYHIDADAMILQFLDKNGEEVQPGETGEIVCTSLFNYAMPFIRYAIGDMGIPSDGTCSCGRTLPLMQMVEGRRDSIIVLPNGQMMTPRAFTNAMRMLKFYDSVEKFRLIQKRLDSFELIMKMKDRNIPKDTVGQELSNLLRAALSLDGSVQIQVRIVEDIPLDKNGKSGIVVSELTPDSKK